jgi:hypothetical protein
VGDRLWERFRAGIDVLVQEQIYDLMVQRLVAAVPGRRTPRD